MMTEQIETVIIGGGQAGLALSSWLTHLGHEHDVLERGRLAERWRSERWDSLTLITPNWMTQLPGYAYQGDDPEGFVGRDEVVRFLEDYAATFQAPLRCGVHVESVQPHAGPARYLVQTTDLVEGSLATIAARNVVVATGPFHRPQIPSLSAALPAEVFQLASRDYRNPAQLPPGAVLVVGSGAYGCPAVLTGVRGGYDLDYDRFAAKGVTLLGHLRGARSGTLVVADDLREILALWDESREILKRMIDTFIQ